METPVFVRGLSRSGGTMLVTLLDAHPSISMAYELYPNLLHPSEDSPTAIELWNILADKSWNEALEKLKPNKIGIYLSRCDRGGLNPEQVIEVLQGFIDDNLTFEGNTGRMEFMARCCRAKQKAESTQRWGLKCSQAFDKYQAIWPDAYYLNIIRDGRDVLASQLNTGAFNPDPAELAKSWCNTHLKFREFSSQDGVNGLEVSYEKLVTDPEPETRRICEFLQLEFDESMLNFHQQDLTIYSATHLSMPQISQPLNDSKIGRWTTDGPEEALTGFLEVAGETMKEFGYNV